jgi:hypothetical protein
MDATRQRRVLATTLALFFLSLCLSILFRDFQAPECTENVRGPVGTQVLINCDSAQIVQDSQDLQRLVNAQTSYQDRPLFPIMGSLLSKPLKKVTKSYEIFYNKDGKPIKFFYANYLAFIGINFLILFFIWHQLVSLLERLRSRKPITFRDELLIGISVGSVLIANNVFKGFFWTPHTQLFNILIVILSINLWLDLESGNFKHRSKLHFFLNGLLLFFYPMFVVLYLLPLIYTWRRYLLPTFLSISPYLAYPLMFQTFGGTYRNAAVEDFNGFVWVLDLGREPRILIDKLEIFFTPIAQLIVPTSLLLAIAFLASLKSNLDLGHVNKYLIFLFFFALFIFLMGYSGPRLIFPLIAALTIFAVLKVFPNLDARHKIYLGFGITIIYLTNFFLTQGPLS